MTPRARFNSDEQILFLLFQLGTVVGLAIAAAAKFFGRVFLFRQK